MYETQEYDRRMCGKNVHTGKKCTKCGNSMTDFDFNIIDKCDNCIEES